VESLFDCTTKKSLSFPNLNSSESLDVVAPRSPLLYPILWEFYTIVPVERLYWTSPLPLATGTTIYRVSINSFPDYKHLLQENYVEYKHIFFLPLLKLVSKTVCHVFIVTFGFWLQNFQTGGLGEMVLNWIC